MARDRRAPHAMIDQGSSRFTEKIWEVLYSWWFNAIVVLLVCVQSFSVFIVTFIDTEKMRIKEYSPENPLAMWRNCSEFRPSFLNNADPEGPRMVCGTLILSIQLLFFVEVVVKLATGIGRFDFDVFEIADIVFVVGTTGFSVYYTVCLPRTHKSRYLQFLVLVRLLRVVRVVQALAECQNRDLTDLLKDTQRFKEVSDNKAEILLLKLEDCRQEIAQLRREEDKRSKKGPANRRLRGTQSLTSIYEPAVQNYVRQKVKTQPSVEINIQTQTEGFSCDRCRLPQSVEFMATRLSFLTVRGALNEVEAQARLSQMSAGAQTVPHPRAALITSAASDRRAERFSRRVSHSLLVGQMCSTPTISPGLISMESGYNSSMSSDRYRQSTSSPFSVYSESIPTTSSSYYSSRRNTVFLFPDARHNDSLESQTGTIELNVLDEVSEVSPAEGSDVSPNERRKNQNEETIVSTSFGILVSDDISESSEGIVRELDDEEVGSAGAEQISAASTDPSVAWR